MMDKVISVRLDDETLQKLQLMQNYCSNIVVNVTRSQMIKTCIQLTFNKDLYLQSK